MKTTKRSLLLLSILLILTTSNAQNRVTKLVVGVNIEGLQNEHLRLFEKKLSVGGFRKITTEGISIKRINQPILPTGQASHIATLLSGTYPCYHNIIGNTYFDSKKNQSLSIVSDKEQSGIGTSNKFSPRHLLATTFTDELKLHSPKSKIHAIAILPETAITLGGHSAESVTWIDEKRGQWASSSYYKARLSRWAEQMNSSGECQNKIQQMWTPTSSMSSYRFPTLSGSRTKSFSHPIRADKDILTNSPIGNELVFDLAQRIIENEKLGTDEYTDALMLDFSLKPFNVNTFSIHTAEQEDIFIRLDALLQRLISQIEYKIGKENVLFVFMLNNSIGHSVEKLKQANIPTGYFNSDKAMALLNSYLMAIYGQNQWVKTYIDDQIYFDNAELKRKNIDYNLFCEKAIEFLNDFEGVQSAYIKKEILHYNGNKKDIRAILQNSIRDELVGDIILDLRPGWQTKSNDGQTKILANPFQSYYSVFLLGNGIPSKTITESFRTIDIAPTICQILQIPYPNACIGKKIDF